jgi:hypothetical protein
MLKKIVNHLLNTTTGWVVGLLTTLGLSFLWLNIIPVVERTGHGPGLPVILLIIMGIVSPVAGAGGLFGGMIPKEGGRKDQTIYAAIFGAFLTTPLALFIFWYIGF